MSYIFGSGIANCLCRRWYMKKYMISLFIVGLIVVSSVAPVLAFTDDFNRANSPDLGPNWTLQGGSSIGIVSNQAATTNAGSYYATVNGFSGSYLSTKVSVDAIDIDTNLSYVAVMFGIQTSGESIFVKVQDQGGNGSFNYYAFYYGNNGGGLFGTLDSPFQAGRITAYAVDADTIRLDIDSNFDGIVDQFYTNSGWSSKTLGTGIGLGMYGTARADNYSTEGGAQTVPEPTTMLLLGLSLAGLAGVSRLRK